MSYGGVSANANLSAMSEGCRLVDVDQKHLPFFFFQFILSSLSLRKSECSVSYDVQSFALLLETQLFQFDIRLLRKSSLTMFLPFVSKLVITCSSQTGR